MANIHRDNGVTQWTVITYYRDHSTTIEWHPSQELADMAAVTRVVAPGVLYSYVTQGKTRLTNTDNVRSMGGED